jgi:alpha-glucosidase (family GH31 glycosyl hydrolase)
MLKKSYLLLALTVFVFQVSRSQQYQKTNTGVITHTAAVNVEVQFFTPSIIRITKFRDSVMPGKKSFSVSRAPDNVELQVVQSGYELFINSSALQVKVNQQSGLVNFYSASGFPLLDEKENAFNFAPVGNAAEKIYLVTQTFQLDEEEAVFGLGQQQKGLMNQRNQTLVIKQGATIQAAPFLLSVKGYGLLWDNYSTTTFKDTTDGTTFESETAGSIDYYFIHGGTADKVIAGYRRLTGPAPMYPQWVFGYGQNRQSDRGKDETAGDAKKYRQLKASQDGAITAQFASMTIPEDLQTQWNILRAQIAAGCNLSVNGIPYYNSDINGYLSKEKYPNAPQDPAYHELYVRWLQFSAFCPVMYSQIEGVPSGIYQFGKKGYWAYDAIEKFMALRYRFLPYNYSNAWDVSSKSGIMMRALVMDFPADKKAWNMNNQYMFGRSLMACPITSSLYISKANGEAVADFSKTRTKKVYLPFGTDWYDFWTGEKFNGGIDIFKEIPIDMIPLYIKAGSIVPMMPGTDESEAGNMEIRIYEGADGSFTLYEDENDNYNYEKGLFATIPMKWNNKDRTLTIGQRKGKFPGMLQNRTFSIIVVGKNKGVGMELPVRYDKVINYSGNAVNIRL